MGLEVLFPYQSEARRLLLLMGVLFAVVLVFRYVEMPDGKSLTSLFPSVKFPVTGKLHEDLSPKSDIASSMTVVQTLNSTDTSASEEIDKNTKMIPNAEEEKRGTVNNTVPESVRSTEVGSNPDVVSSNGSLKEKYDISSSNNGKHLSGDLAAPSPASAPAVLATNIKEKNRDLWNDMAPESKRGSEDMFGSGEVSSGRDNLPSEESLAKENDASTTKHSGHHNGGLPAHSSALPLAISSSSITSPTVLDVHFLAPAVSIETDAPTGLKGATDTHKGKDNERGSPHGESTSLANDSCITRVSSMNDKSTTKVVSTSEMNKILLHSRTSSCSMRPRWSSVVDEELLNVKTLIENAPVLKIDAGLYGPVFRNVSMFKRSYELMEQTLKVYIYKEGEKPIFHGPYLQGIYASEGWFMKLMEVNQQFVTRNPRKAHLFYLPFSTRMLEDTMYVRGSDSYMNLIEYLKSYLDVIVAKYPHWNRTAGADHFLVACHDWAPGETKEYMNQCIRALCNSDVREGFQFGKDVSLPETIVHNPKKPLRELGGGKPPSQRQILAFFAGRMHGSTRTVLLKYWGNKDPDMKIFGPTMRGKKGTANYIHHMKSSKYCICARGYEVNSPRVVEAIYYECVPVIISDNFVPPLFEVLNWDSFSVFIPEKEIPNLKNILLSISQERYLEMQMNVKKVQQHFLWHTKPVKYDLFHMILHSIWYNRVFQLGPSE